MHKQTCKPMYIHIQSIVGWAWASPSLRDCVDGISVCMYVCMHVCMYGGHSVLHSNSILHDNFGKMQTHACPRMPCIIPGL